MIGSAPKHHGLMALSVLPGTALFASGGIPERHHGPVVLTTCGSARHELTRDRLRVLRPLQARPAQASPTWRACCTAGTKAQNRALARPKVAEASGPSTGSEGQGAGKTGRCLDVALRKAPGDPRPRGPCRRLGEPWVGKAGPRPPAAQKGLPQGRPQTPNETPKCTKGV